jgi:NodT family efflux transporter outer membrane factor (OMF) lipoprotein
MKKNHSVDSNLTSTRHLVARTSLTACVHPAVRRWQMPAVARVVATVSLVSLLGACSIGALYQRPNATANPISDHYKEAEGWAAAQPADALQRDAWWQPFGDATLDKLAASVAVSNQNIAAAVASYAQARAVVGQQRAALFPSVSLSGQVNRSNGKTTQRDVQFGLGGSWEPDVWGRLQRAVDGATANAEASAGDLATATLSAQGELVTNYLLLRQTDEQRRLLGNAIRDYQRVLEIATNRYNAGVAPKTDVLQAQTQLANAQSEAEGLQRTRAQLEHAIAVLVGEQPANFALQVADWNATVPPVPLLLPSQLLQRRPDIAAAERRVKAANEQIGIQRSAYFPTITLGASEGVAAASVAALSSNPVTLWSIGVAMTQSIFNAGLVKNRIAGAEAAYEATVAQYRQTVLSAFQSVEDQLAATRVLAQQETFLAQASSSANAAEQQVLNRYRAGQVSFLEVVTAQTTALNARRALVQQQGNRQVASVALIQALGGGWSSTTDSR